VPVASSKHTRKDLQIIKCFWSQHIYLITIAFCSCELGTEKIHSSLSNNQQMSAIQQRKLFIQSYKHL